MSDQNVQIAVQMGNVDAQLKQFSASINENAKVLENLTASMVQFNQAGQATRAQMTGIAEDGKKVVANIRLQGSEIKKLTVLVRENADAMRAARQAQREAELSARIPGANAAAAKVNQQIGLDPKVLDERARAMAERLQQSLAQSIAKNNVSQDTVDRLLGKVKSGDVSAEASRANQQVEASLRRQLELKQRIEAQQRKVNEETAKEAAANLAQRLRNNQAGIADSKIRGMFPVPSGADIATLARYEAALGRIRQLIASGATTPTEAFNVAKAVSANQVLPNLTPGGQQVQSILGNLKKSFDDFGTNGVSAIQKVDQAWNRLQQAFIAITIFNVLNRLTSAFTNAVQGASEFQLKIAEIRTISQDSQLSFARWSQGLQQISEQFGRPIGDVAAAQYQLISNQVAQGARSLEVMNSVARLAVATNSSLEASVNSVSGALNSFGLSAEHAERVAAVLFKTVELGRVTLPELQNTIGRVGGIASALGISLEEVGAALSTLTIKG